MNLQLYKKTQIMSFVVHDVVCCFFAIPQLIVGVGSLILGVPSTTWYCIYSIVRYNRIYCWYSRYPDLRRSYLR